MTSRDLHLRQAQPITAPSQAATQSEERFAAGLALIAGYIGAYAFIRYKVYVSFMSGNTTQVGSLAGQGDFTAAVPALLAIVFFVVGAFVGTLIGAAGWRQPYRLLFGLTTALLVGDIALTQFVTSPASEINIALLSLAMGLMNTALSHVGAQSVNLVFVTGTLTTMARHLALALTHAPLPESQGEWDTHLRRGLLLLGLWTALLVGAILGGAVSHLGVGVLIIPAVVLAALAAFRSVPEG
jgi:uncharacterized membrane protein YoaK (UPF0700 family)